LADDRKGAGIKNPTGERLVVSEAEFDEFAAKYEKTMERSCAVSGESPDFYAKERIRWCLRRLSQYLPAETVLDFGCGTGGSIGYFFESLGCQSVVGIDPSGESLQVAKERHWGRNVRLSKPEDFVPSGNIQLAFCNGVFHHIPPSDRLNALNYIRSAMSDDGILAFWENNPWNPVVVYSMSLNEFDRNAQTLSPARSTHLLKQAGFRVLFVDYCFFFPHFARRLRGLEPALRRVPLGAQYLVVARK
jgi:SAM-dependent methyltransferase